MTGSVQSRASIASLPQSFSAASSSAINTSDTANAGGSGAAQEEELQDLSAGGGSEAPHTEPVPEEFYTGFWITCVAVALLLAWYYWTFDGEQFEILRMLTSSVMPLAVLSLVVLVA